MELTATFLPITTTRLWCNEKDRMLSETWTCEAGHDLNPREAEGSCSICWAAGLRTPTYERGF